MDVFSRILEAWIGSGERRSTLEMDLRHSLPSLAAGPSEIVISWPESASFLRVSARSGDEQFARSEDPAAGTNVLSGKADPAWKLQVGLSVDTDDPAFAEAGRRGPVRVPLRVVAKSGSFAVEVALEPASPMKRHEGFVAIDLAMGALTWIDAGRAGGADSVEVVPHAGPSVLLDEYEPATPGGLSRARASMETDTGRGDRFRNAASLLAGPQRTVEASAGKGRIAIPQAEPVEYLASALFRRFHEGRHEVPRWIAAVCPATWTAAEAGRLREAVRFGWRRSLGARRREFDELRLADLPAVVIEEGEAAAWFHLHREYLEAPGGLGAFRYLYPEGMRLLVVSEGWATTAISAHHAEADGAEVAVTTLARSTVRDAGADAVALAVFRILHARLASGTAPRPFPPPPEPAHLADWLRRHGRQIAEALPAVPGGESPDLFSRLLWAMAELMASGFRRWTAGTGGGEHLREVRLSQFAHHESLLAELSSRVGRGPLPPVARDVRIRREEAEALVRPVLERVADRTATFARQAFPEGGPHAVYLCGRQYPLFLDILRERLAVPFLDTRLMMGDENAAAKGAALALRLRGENAGTHVRFTPAGSCLPFDLAAPEPGGGMRVLFRAGERYAELALAILDLPSSTPTALRHRGYGGRVVQAVETPRAIRDVVLHRRWPGEEEFAPAMRFRFSRSVTDQVTFSYRFDEMRFVAMSDQGEAVAEEEL